MAKPYFPIPEGSTVGPSLGEAMAQIQAEADRQQAKRSIPAATERQAVGKDAPGAKGRRVQGQQNALERAYEQTVLEPLKRSGAILGYWFEPLKLRLGKACYYEIDYLVMLADCTLEVHECKALWSRKGRKAVAGFREDARVKFKVAAERYPFLAFVAVIGRKRKGCPWEWTEERL